MKKQTRSISLQSYAFQLRKLLTSGCALDILLDSHKKHQDFLVELSPLIDSEQLSLPDRFAWKFLREINILNMSFLKEELESFGQGSNQRPKNSRSKGVYQDLEKTVLQVRDIWFPGMKTLPSVVWLKQFTTRKLAHYAKLKDEIAFSLIFDSPDVSPEIMNYLAYHELLHRQVGTKVVNGRRYHHTGEFKQQEKLFPNWRNIEQQITAYITNTR